MIEAATAPKANIANGSKPKRIAVIGAGACGICAAKYLSQAGLDVTIFEIGSQIGGMWCYENDNGRSSAYRTLHINTSRGVTRFHDLDFDPDVQFFPDHWDMHKYLIKYARHFDVEKLIRFNTKVADIRPCFDPKTEPPLWELVFEDGSSERYDAVIAATGHLSVPLHVPMFQNDFKGEYLHAHYYREPEPYVGKRICIIGVGNSACDISGDVCATVQRCVLVARSGVLILPKLLFGLPFTDITRKIQRPWVPASIRRRLTRWLTYLAHGDITKLGFKPLVGKRAHVTSNGTIVTDVAYSRIEIKNGIEKIDGKTIHFVDGTSEEFDVLIAATGYLIDLPFVSRDIVPMEDNRLDLYKRMMQPGWPGLYFMGFFNLDSALNMVYEYQARWVRDIELGEANLPSASEMKADIARKREWVHQNYKDSPRHTIEEEHVPYIQELKKSQKAMRRAVGY